MMVAHGGNLKLMFAADPRFKLPRNIAVSLTGVDFMSVVVSMPPEARPYTTAVGIISPSFHCPREQKQSEAGQGGYCGDFNGDPDDDAEPIVPSWDRPIGRFLGPVPKAGFRV